MQLNNAYLDLSGDDLIQEYVNARFHQVNFLEGATQRVEALAQEILKRSIDILPRDQDQTEVLNADQVVHEVIHLLRTVPPYEDVIMNGHFYRMPNTLHPRALTVFAKEISSDLWDQNNPRFELLERFSREFSITNRYWSLFESDSDRLNESLEFTESHKTKDSPDQ
jgi:uncharacterized membrane protein YgcG